MRHAETRMTRALQRLVEGGSIDTLASMQATVRRVDVGETTSLEDYSTHMNLHAAVHDLRHEAEILLPRLAGRRLWMLNSTEHGGGVAEMLPRVSCEMPRPTRAYSEVKLSRSSMLCHTSRERRPGQAAGRGRRARSPSAASTPRSRAPSPGAPRRPSRAPAVRRPRHAGGSTTRAHPSRRPGVSGRVACPRPRRRSASRPGSSR